MRTITATTLVLLALVVDDKFAIAFSPTRNQQRKNIAVEMRCRLRPQVPCCSLGSNINGLDFFGRSGTTMLRNDNQREQENDTTTAEQEGTDDLLLESSTPSSSIPPLPKLDASILIPWFLFVSFWPLLALVRLQLDGVGNPVELFDIDKYTALKEMMQDPPDFDEIMELPPLSPAEKIVGAFFGPPR